MMRLTTLIMATMITGGAIAGTMYEWRDPATGALKAGDKPPTGGIEYWAEGHRPQPKAQPPLDASPALSHTSAVIKVCNTLRPVARAAFNVKMQGVPLFMAESKVVPQNAAPETAKLLKDAVRSVYRYGTSEQQSEELIYQACLITYGGKQ